MSDEVRSIPPIEPVLDPKKDYVEINSYVVFWGLFYAAVFTLAVGYLCLKIGPNSRCLLRQYLYLLWVQQLF